MGRIYSGVPPRLLAALKNNFPALRVFVETGTFHGRTAQMASQLFEHVITIERSDILYQQASQHLSGLTNTEVIHGDSREKLPEVVAELEEPAIFWLDAHWCFGNTYGQGEPCPILDEIKAINQANQEHFILIDDARGFLSPPEPPHKPEHWPDITTVLAAINTFSKPRYTVIIEDVIITVPLMAKPLITKYCQEINLEIFKRLYAS